MDSSERTSLLSPRNSSQVIQALDKRRWYILLVFFMCSAVNGLVWNTWGPIQGTSQVVFGWNDTTVTLLPFWGPVVYIFAFLPISWLMDVKGLRYSTLLLGITTFLGAGLRAIPSENLLLQTCLVNLAMIFNSIGGPVAMAMGPLLSAVWFPPHQRTTSTAISSLSSYVGTGMSFIIGPMIVPDVCNHSQTRQIIDFRKIREGMNSSQLSYLKERIMDLMYIECGVSALLLLIIIIYFPKKPTLPPSVTAASGRLDFKSGCQSLLHNKQFSLLLFINGIILGVYSGWLSILDLNLSQFGILQGSAGWLGFGASVSGIAAGILISILADLISRHLKAIQLVLLVCAAVSFTAFTLICAGIIPYNKPILYLTCISAGFFTNAAIPLFFEMAVESAYPVAEGVTSGLLTVASNALQLVFYIFPMLPSVGLKWINWCACATFAVCIPLLAAWRERYYRSEMDDQGSTKKTARLVQC